MIAKKIVLLGVGASTLLMPFAAMAQIQPLPDSPVRSVSDVISVLNFIVRIIFTVLMIVAIAFILYAAFKYLTAMGSPERVQEAHRALLWAAVAIAVALVATGVRAIIESILRRTG